MEKDNKKISDENLKEITGGETPSFRTMVPDGNKLSHSLEPNKKGVQNDPTKEPNGELDCALEF